MLRSIIVHSLASLRALKALTAFTLYTSTFKRHLLDLVARAL
jgi:hypothetical protein